jgi:hypothetical protein
MPNTRVLSQSIKGDVYQIDDNLRTTSSLLSTGYIIVEENEDGRIRIGSCNSDGIPNGKFGIASRNGLTGENTKFVRHVPLGGVGGRRKRKSRRK